MLVCRSCLVQIWRDLKTWSLKTVIHQKISMQKGRRPNIVVQNRGWHDCCTVQSLFVLLVDGVQCISGMKSQLVLEHCHIYCTSFMNSTNIVCTWMYQDTSQHSYSLIVNDTYYFWVASDEIKWIELEDFKYSVIHYLWWYSWIATFYLIWEIIAI